MIVVTRTPEGITIEGAESVELFSRELLENPNLDNLEVDGETIVLRALNGTWTYRCPALSKPAEDPIGVVTGYLLCVERGVAHA